MPETHEVRPIPLPWYGALGLLALLARIPAFLAPAELSYDDGVYQAAIRSMREGNLPFRQVFSAQGPLFYPVVWLGDLLGFQSEHGPRVAPVLAGIVITACAAWLASKRSTTAFWIVGILVATSGSLLRTTSALTSDGIALAWAMMALCFAVAQCHTSALRRNEHVKRSLPLGQLVTLGVLTGFALGTKNLLVLPIFAIVALIVHREFGLRTVVAFGTIGLTFVLAWMAIWDFKKAYQQSIQYHLEKTAHQTFQVRWHKLVTTLWERDLPILIACAIALILFLVTQSQLQVRPRRWQLGTGLTSRGALTVPVVLLWAFLTVGVVLGESAMFANHVSFMVVPLALACCPTERMRSTIAVPVARVIHSSSARSCLGAALILVVTGVALETRSRDFMDPPEPSRAMRAVADEIQSLPPDAFGISDEPGVLALAGLRVPAFFADGSRMRLESDVPGIQLNSDLIVAEAQKDSVCIVLAWQAKIWGSLDDLGPRLATVGYSATDLGHSHVLYRKASPFCDA